MTGGKVVLKEKNDYIDLFDCIGSFLIESKLLKDKITKVNKKGMVHELVLKDDKITFDSNPNASKNRRNKKIFEKTNSLTDSYKDDTLLLGFNHNDPSVIMAGGIQPAKTDANDSLLKVEKMLNYKETPERNNRKVKIIENDMNFGNFNELSPIVWDSKRMLKEKGSDENLPVVGFYSVESSNKSSARHINTDEKNTVKKPTTSDFIVNNSETDDLKVNPKNLLVINEVENDNSPVKNDVKNQLEAVKSNNDSKKNLVSYEDAKYTQIQTYFQKQSLGKDKDSSPYFNTKTHVPNIVSSPEKPPSRQRTPTRRTPSRKSTPNKYQNEKNDKKLYNRHYVPYKETVTEKKNFEYLNTHKNINVKKQNSGSNNPPVKKDKFGPILPENKT